MPSMLEFLSLEKKSVDIRKIHKEIIEHTVK